MSNNLEIYNAFRSVPDEAKKTIGGGRLKGFTDVNPMFRIKSLTERFGACGFGWYIEEIEKWTESSGEEKVCFVKIHLFIKVGEEWSKPIVGIGGSSLVAKESKGLFLSDEAYKMAYTDAISIACKALGMAADVYYEKDRTKYDAPAPALDKKDMPIQQSDDLQAAIIEVLAVQSRSSLVAVNKQYRTLYKGVKSYDDAILEMSKKYPNDKS
jgi:hypothetical protein